MLGGSSHLTEERRNVLTLERLKGKKKRVAKMDVDEGEMKVD